MGTSSSGKGAGGSNPLIPSWIPADDSDTDTDSTQVDSDGNETDSSATDAENPDQQNNKETKDKDASDNRRRFRQPRSDFNKYVRSKGSNTDVLKGALKGYSRKAAGNTSNLARRMTPSSLRVADFFGVINTVKQSGKDSALRQFNLSSYSNKPLIEILSALSDEIFKENGDAYENTQDDSIIRQAYANAVNRISQIDDIDLDNLSNQQVEVMIAIFVEETIAQRVICDIGNEMVEIESDIMVLLDIENNVYQIVSGLVRTQIMPEIIATQRGDKTDLLRKIRNIYRIAFDAMAGLKE